MIRFLQRHKGVRGSVTILMLVIMLPMMVFSFTIVDMVKIFMAKDVVADASQLAVNAGMTSYDKVLKDVYGILATSKTEEELSEKMTAYYAATLAAQGLANGDADIANLVSSFINGMDGVDAKAFEGNNSFLRVNPEKTGSGAVVSVNAYDSSAVSNPAVMERQILEYMKYRGPVNLGLGMLEKLNALKDLPNQSAVVTERMEFENKLNEINNNVIDAYTLFQLFFNNNNRADGLGTSETIANENEKKNLIRDYGYTGDPLPIIASKSKYGDIVALRDIIVELKTASALSALYAPYFNGKIEGIDFESYEDDYYRGSASNLVNKLNSAAGSLENINFDGKNFAEVAEALNKSQSDIHAYALKYELNKDSVRSDDPPLDGNDVTELCDLAQAINAFAGLYGYSGSLSNNSNFVEEAENFLEAYYTAEAMSNNDKLSDDDLTILAGALSDSGIKEKLRDIKNMDKWMVNVVSYLSAEANDYYTSAVSQMNMCYNFANKQTMIIDELTRQGGQIDGILDKFTNAKTQAESYQQAITAVETDTQKNSAQQTYDKEAQYIRDLDEDKAKALKGILNSYRPAYNFIREALLEMKVLTEVNSGITVFDDKGAPRQSTIEAYYKNASVKLPMGVGGYDFLFNSAESSKDSSSVNFRANWSQYNDPPESLNAPEIKENEIFIEIKKLSTPTRETEKNPEVKKKVMENTKTTSKEADKEKGEEPSMPSEIKTDDSDEEMSEEDKKAFEEMQGATKFSDYIANDSKEANAVIPFDRNNDRPHLTDEEMQVTANCDTGSDESARNGATNMINAVSNMMSVIGNLLEEGRDALFITEYLVGNFSCHTTSMDGKGKRLNNENMLSGVPFYSEKDGEVTKNVGYGTELEYILYGCKTEAGNKAAAGGTIFAIRFVLNLIYSFTDAEIRSFTLSAATAASGWFPFAVPIVQTVLHIGLALAESAVDIYYLRNGAAVPLYKTADTWVCKGTNIVRTVVGEVVTQVADAAIDAASDAVCDFISNTEGKINTKATEVKEYVDLQVESMKSQVKNTVMEPINEAVQDAMMNISLPKNPEEITQELINTAAAEISGKLKVSLGQLRDSAQNAVTASGEGENSVVDQAIFDIVDKVLIPRCDSIANVIAANLNSYIEVSDDISVDSCPEELEKNKDNGELSFGGNFGPLASQIESSLSDIINKAENGVEGVSERLKALTGKLEERVTSAISELSTELQDGVKHSAEEIKGKLSAKVSTFVEGHKNVNIVTSSDSGSSGKGGKVSLTKGDGGKTEKGKQGTTAKHTIDLTYKDYLYVFVAIGVFANRDNILERAALLMQANCKVRGAKPNSGEDYTLNQVRTFFEAKAGASTSTVFYGAVFKDGQLDMSGARKKYEFTYTAYMGY